MASAQDADEREDYVVRIVEFPGDTGAVIGALQRVFGLSEPEARALLAEVPVEVRRGINRIRADYFRRALELSGARAEVRDADGELVPPGAPQLMAARVPREPARQSGPNPRPPSAPIADANAWQQQQQPAPLPSGSARRPSAPLGAGTWSAGTPVRQDPSGVVQAAGASPAKTLVMGSVPAPAPIAPRMSGETKPENDTAPAAPGGWGDFQPMKNAAAAPTAPAAPAAQSAKPPPPRERPPEVMGGPRELSTSDLPEGGLHLGARLELSFSAPPVRSSFEGDQSPIDIDRGNLPSGPPLELGGEEQGMGESKPRYEAIPAGARWKAPGADTLARARRKHMVHSLESGLADPRPSPVPPGMSPPPPPRRLSDRPKPRNSPMNPPVRPVKPKPAELGFWQVSKFATAGSAMGFSVRIAIASALVGAAAELWVRVPLAGIVATVISLVFLLALCGEYHRKILWAAATGDDELNEPASFEVAALIRTGLPIASFAAFTQVLLWVWLISELKAGHPARAIVGSPALWVLGFGPGFYWPIALACASARNQPFRVWDVARGLRALGREPMEIARVALAGGGIFMAALALMTVIASAVHLDGPLGFFVAAGLPLAISHALMGAWTGRLVYARPDVFE